MTIPLKSSIVLAGLALAASLAVAQTPMTPASAPAAVGVSGATAAEANQKAVPRSDTATVVRTAPTATERAGAAGNGMAASPTGTPSTPVARAPKADRN